MPLTARDKIRFLKYHIHKPYVDDVAVRKAICEANITVYTPPRSRGNAKSLDKIPEKNVRDYIKFFAESHPFVRGKAAEINEYLKEHAETVREYKEYKLKMEDLNKNFRKTIENIDDTVPDSLEIDLHRMRKDVLDNVITGRKNQRNMIYEYDQRSLAAAFSNIFFTEPIPSDEEKLEHILNDVTNIAIEKGADYVKKLTFITGSLSGFYKLLADYPTIDSLKPKADEVSAPLIKKIGDIVEKVKSEINEEDSK